MTLHVSEVDGHWTARDADRLLGEAWQWVRPDGKHFMHLQTEDTETVEALARAAAVRVGRPVHTHVDADDHKGFVRLAAAGFVGERYEHRWTMPVAVAAAWSDAALDGFDVGSPERFDDADLRRLDDRLRLDSPGLWGWRWTAEGWDAEHAKSYDPSVYPVAWDPAARRFVGMARVWMRPEGPRLGLVAVDRHYRRQGVGAALLTRAFRVLRDRGHAEVVTECDAANLASRALITKAGGRATGGSVELVWRLDPA